MIFEVVDYQEESTPRYTDLFKNDPVFDAIIKTIVPVVQEYQGFYGEYYASFLNIDNSVGKQLDMIGSIVGQPRLLLNFITDPYFGFQGAPNAQSFGTELDSEVGGYWRSITNPQAGTNLQLDDEIYRKLIKARIIKNNSRGTVTDFLSVMNILTDNVLTSVTDVSTATISATASVVMVEPVNPLATYFLGRLRLSDNLIPIPLGVKLTLTTAAPSIYRTLTTGENRTLTTGDIRTTE